MTSPKEIKDFAKSNGYDNAKYLGEWQGYKVYEPTFNDDKTHYVGYPLSILQKDDKIRFTTEQECFAVLDFFPDND